MTAATLTDKGQITIAYELDRTEVCKVLKALFAREGAEPGKSSPVRRGSRS